MVVVSLHFLGSTNFLSVTHYDMLQLATDHVVLKVKRPEVTVNQSQNNLLFTFNIELVN